MTSYPLTDGVTTFLPPPDGYVVDFDNPQQQKALDHYLIFGILGPLALICLVQRIYTKRFITGSLKIDDGMARPQPVRDSKLTHIVPRSLDFSRLGEDSNPWLQ